MTAETKIVLYGTSWCPAVRRARAFLDRHAIAYCFIDIDKDLSACQVVENLNHGYRSVPTLVFPDGSHLTEPSEAQLAQKLGIEPTPS